MLGFNSAGKWFEHISSRALKIISLYWSHLQMYYWWQAHTTGYRYIHLWLYSPSWTLASIRKLSHLSLALSSTTSPHSASLLPMWSSHIIIGLIFFSSFMIFQNFFGHPFHITSPYQSHDFDEFHNWGVVKFCVYDCIMPFLHILLSDSFCCRLF